MKASEIMNAIIDSYCDDCPSFSCAFCSDRETLRKALDLLEKQEADGCVGCKYIGKDKYEMPCLRCKRNMQDLWKAEKRLEELSGEE